MQSVFGDVTIPKVQANYTDHATVLAVQTALAARGYRPKKGANNGLDGIWGEETHKALQAWEYETSSDDTTGLINYGVLLKLGISPPGAAASAQRMNDASAVANATAAMHAGQGLSSQDTVYTPPAESDYYGPPAPQSAPTPSRAPAASPAQVAAAKAAVDVAKARVEAAPTPQAQAVAQQQLAVAQQHLDTVAPSIPAWQIALAAVGVLGIGAGVYSLFSGRGKRR